MDINTNYTSIPTIPDAITFGTVNDEDEVAVSESASNANLRITVANSLGVSDTTNSTSVASATSTVNDILLKYTSARSQVSSSSVLVDIYTIMNLMQQMAQKLRDAMRELRQLELTTIQTNIKNQAQQERTAALTQLIAGCATFALQATVALGGAVKQIRGINQEINANATQGMDVAKSQAEIAGLGDSKKAIDTKVTTLEKDLDPNTKSALDQQYQQADTKITHDQLATKVETAKTNLTELTKTQGQTDVNNAQAKVTEAETKVTEAKAEVESAKNALPEAKAAVESAGTKVRLQEATVSRLQTGVDEAQAKVDAAQTKVDAAQAKVDDANRAIADSAGLSNEDFVKLTEASTAAEGDLAAAKTELEAATDKLDIANNKLSVAGYRLDTAKAELNLAQTHVTTLENTANGTELAEANTKLETAKTELETAKTLQAQGKSVTETPEMTALKTEIEATSQKISQNDAQGKFNANASSYEDIAEQAQVEYNKALGEVNVERATKAGVQPESQKKLDAAAKKLTYARAREIQHLQQTEGGAVKINNITDRLTASYGNKLKAVEADTGKVSKAIVYASAAMQMSEALGRLGQQAGDSIAAWQKAKATEMQADEKANEEQLNQLQDLFTNMMTTIEKVQQLYAEVTQKESQTVEEISGAIRG